MLTINIQIDNADFESALAKSITLAEGGDLSKEMTNIYLEDLKKRAGVGLDVLAEEQVKEAIATATEQAKADFEVIIEAVKPKEIIKGK